MRERILDQAATFAALPPPWKQALLPDIQKRVTSGGQKLVVLDDDPTGTQTVHGIAVLTTWTVDALVAELRCAAPAFYILTNSRSLTPAAAQALNAEIGANLKQAAARARVPIAVVSRSDSTLRGHYPGEVEALAQSLNMESWPCLIIPFFQEGGRYTIDDVHYVADGGRLIPAGQTAFAQDAAFGFSHSNLRQWVAEKTGGRISADAVVSIGLDVIRQGGPTAVAQCLAGLAPHGVGIVNAADYNDMEVLVAGLLQAEARGNHFIYRTAASFVRVRAGINPRALLNAHELSSPASSGGLFIVGSYVPQTTEQVQALLAQKNVIGIKASVARLLDRRQGESEMLQIARQADANLQQGRDVVIFTSRQLVRGADADGSLDIGRHVSDSLIAIVSHIRQQPRYLVAKGGITSSDVATRGLGVTRALVLGQALPGVPVWQLGSETRYPGMAYIVFPGNVGDADALAGLQRQLAV